jgi:di/tricarboxylate transporter
MSDITITFLVLVGVVVLFVWNRLPVEVVAIGSALVLYACGILELSQVYGGFGDATVVFIATLFVVSEGLDASGVTAWAGQQLMSRTGSDRRRVIVLMMVLAAVLAAVITPNGAVAALVPVVVVLAIRAAQAPSQLMLPLAFAAHAGSMLALTGTPVNVLVADAADDAGVGRFGFFSFTLVGVPLLIGSITIAVLLGRRLLPERHPESMPSDLSQHATTLREQYLADHEVYRLTVTANSTITGRHTDDVDLTPYPSVRAVGVQRGGIGRPTATRMDVGDVLIVRGDPDDIHRLSGDLRLDESLGTSTADDGGELITRTDGIVDFVIAPRSTLIGRRVFPGMVAEDGNVVVLAVQRRGRDLGATETTLETGDTLLLSGSWTALEREANADLLAVDAPDDIRRQAVPLGLGARRAIVILIVMVILMATGAVPASVASLLAAMALLVTRVLTVEQAYRGVNWTAVLLVGGMIPLTVAMQETGAAERLATGLVELVGDSGAYALMFGLFVLTVVLGQLISNTATALIVIPIAVSAASQLDVSAKPILMGVTVAASASFLTPVATPGNLMVMRPGGYVFGDYWKFGLPFVAWSAVVAMGLVPLIWRF